MNFSGLKFELNRQTGLFSIGYGYGSSPTFGTVLVGDGTAAAPSIAFASDTGTGFRRSAAGITGYSSGGSGSLSFASGGVIYGADASSYLQITSAGAINLVSAGTNQSITLTPSGTGNLTVVNTINNIAAKIGSSGLYLGIKNTSPASGHLQLCYNTTAFVDLAPTFSFNVGRSLVEVNGPADGLMVQGHTLLGGLTTDGTGVLQFPAATTSAGGITFGTDTWEYRKAAGELAIDSTQGVTRIRLLQNTGLLGCSLYNSAGSLGLYTDTAASVLIGTNGTTALTLDSSQICTHAAGVVFSTVNTQTAATYTVAATDNYIIANRAGTVTLTLGTATNGRRLVVRTITANTVVSASSNVVPLAGGAAGTAILAATAGKWAELVGDGTNWQIQASA